MGVLEKILLWLGRLRLRLTGHDRNPALQSEIRQEKEREAALASAAETDPSVDDQLFQSRCRLFDLLSQIERGAPADFLLFIGVFAVLETLLAIAFPQINKELLSFWPSPGDSYLLHYRWLSSRIWALSQFIQMNWWTLFIPLLLVYPLWALQWRLARGRARTLFALLTAVSLLSALVIFCSWLRCSMLPL